MQDSTLSVELVSAASRTSSATSSTTAPGATSTTSSSTPDSAAGSGGVLLYVYEYDLDSTRGRKRVLNTLAIARNQLFILNAQVG